MRKLATALALAAAALWSALVWGSYALLAWAGSFVAENAGAAGLPAELREVALWAGLFVENFGQGTATVIWLLGIGLIGLLLLVFNMLAGRLAPAQSSSPEPVAPPPPRAATAWGRNGGRG